MRILLVEDESDIALNLKKYLKQQKFEVDIASTISYAWNALNLVDYPLVILDRRLPDGDGIELIRKSQRLTKVPRYLILSALGEVVDKIHGLNLGANDYMTKPFEPDELLARIKAMLRMPRLSSGGVITLTNLSYDRGSRQFSIGGEVFELRRREMEILEMLITRKDQIVSRENLFDRLYGFEEIPSENTLDSHVSRLRRRLVEVKADVKIQAARNLGYLLLEKDK